MSHALQHILQSVGLEEREAELYLAGLRLGSAPASAYATITKGNRITTYNTLELLVKKGIFTSLTQEKGKFYEPIDPEKFSIEARKNVDALERNMSELRSLMGVHHRTPVVRYVTGIEGVRKIYDDTLTAKSEICNFANSKIIRTVWKEYDKEYVTERVKRNIYLKGIAPDDAVGRKIQGQDHKAYREIRLVSAKDFPMNNEIIIYDQKVAVISFSNETTELFGVVIESTEVASTQRNIFEMAWRYAGLGEGRRVKKHTKEHIREDQLSIHFS